MEDRAWAHTCFEAATRADLGEVPADPTVRMRPPIVPDKPVPIVPDDGLKRLFQACAGNSFEARRDTALISCCWTPAPAGTRWSV